MSIPIPRPQKPIQLFMWSKCAYCTKQKRVLSSMDAEMTNWFQRNVDVTEVHEPKMYPMVKGYPFWVINGKAAPGFKTMSEIVSMRRIAP
jgi:glutaredoxin